MLETSSNHGILAVIVLYKMRHADSASFQTLNAAIPRLGEQHLPVHILLYDNSEKAEPPVDLPENVRYHAAERNDGIAGAYNFALRHAVREGFTWMLTLDQDTQLPPEFLVNLQALSERLNPVHEVGAIVPHLAHAGRQLSPVRIRPWGVKYLPPETAGFLRGEIHAFNSGTLFRVRALQQIGGFDPCFWLDYQDASIFRHLHQCGRRIYIAENLQVEHNLSLLSAGDSMGVERFRNFLLAESAYCDLHRGRIARAFLTLRLMGRFWRQLRNGADPTLRQLTRKALLRRIFRTRRRRIQEWRDEMLHRMRIAAPAMVNVEPMQQRPAISVCMAAYNGERYIAAQLQSILSQLDTHDEVIVVDDASKDETRNVVRSLDDRRIRLIEHASNLGVLRTFEDAIRAASGRIIFLSDQDDLWAPRKVAAILDGFRSNPDVSLIASDVALIDADDNLLAESYFRPRGGFRAGLWANLIRNRFGGCTMAFRSEVIGEILPLPHRYDVLHDLWIGVRCSLSGHKTLFIPDPLVYNRRHSSTATGQKRLTLARRIQIRIHMLLALAEFWIGGLVW